MEDLIDWLREQIAEADRIARADPWSRPHGPDCGIAADYCPECNCEYWREVVAHCEAHERMLNFVLGMGDTAELLASQGPAVQSMAAVANAQFEHALKLLALAYQHHSGYLSEWRP